MSIRIEGLDDLIKKATPDILNRPMARFLKRAALKYVAGARKRSPVDTGRTRNSIAYELDNHTPPLWAKVGSNVTSDNFPYPAALDSGDQYHYRGGGALGLAGQQTEGWFTEKTREDVLPDIGGFLNDLGNDIVRQWER